MQYVRVTFSLMSNRAYTYKTNEKVSVGDEVVVNTPRDGFALVRVFEVMDTLPKKLAKTKIKWLVTVIDPTEYKALTKADLVKSKT